MQALAPEGFLRVAWYTTETDCLGPGKRFALWVQGCEQRCTGCIAKPLQDLGGGTLLPIAELVQRMLDVSTVEYTISGGEPFLQAAELAALLETVRAARPDCGVILYTGLRYETLARNADAQALLACVDLLIDGQYVPALDDGKPMRGSSNQRLLFLTNRYDPTQMPQFRHNQVQFTANGFRMIGIPSEGARQFLAMMQQTEKEDWE